MQHKVSVIIPVYNTPPTFIEEAINSVLGQTYDNIEIIIVDDGSKNSDTLKYLNTISDKAKVIHRTNGGPAAARNTGIESAMGEFILPLDADDKIAPPYVEKALTILLEQPSIGVVYSEAAFFGNKSGKWKLPTFSFDSFIFGNSIFVSGLFRKNVWQSAGRYDEQMRFGYEDWDFWLSILELGLKPYQIPEVLFYYRKWSDSSMDSVSLQNREVVLRQIVENHLSLYLNSPKAITGLFSYPQISRLSKKYKKYKRLFLLFLVVFCLETVLLFWFYWNFVAN